MGEGKGGGGGLITKFSYLKNQALLSFISKVWTNLFCSPSPPPSTKLRSYAYSERTILAKSRNFITCMLVKVKIQYECMSLFIIFHKFFVTIGGNIERNNEMVQLNETHAVLEMNSTITQVGTVPVYLRILPMHYHYPS